MSFKPEPVQPDFAELITSLTNSKLQIKDNALYQTIYQIIQRIGRARDLLLKDIKEIEDKLTIISPFGISGFPPGIDGEDGLDGFPGIQGLTGLTGNTGARGINGQQGIPGLDGIDGDEFSFNIPDNDRPVSDGLLSTNIPRKNAANAFTGANSFATNPLDLLVGQLKFPATQNPSTDTNTLDDYEEGAWTPVIGGATSESGQAYSIQIGNYIKVGKLVAVLADVTLSTLGTITGIVAIKGMPFTVDATISGGGSIGFFTAMTSTFVFLTGSPAVNTTRISLFCLKIAATGVVSLAQADLSNTTRIIATAFYQAST